MTLKHYNVRVRSLMAKLEALRKEAKAFDDGHRDDVDDWNLHHDIIASTEKALLDLDRQWETRHYTADDWAELNRIANNVD